MLQETLFIFTKITPMTYKVKPLKIIAYFSAIILLFSSCASHQRSNIQSNENFIVELTKPKARGSLVHKEI